MDIDFSAVTGFIADHSAWAMPIIFLVVFCESFAVVSLLVPGTAILAASGALVGAGTVSAFELLSGAIPGAILGDAISYWLGRRYGRAIMGLWPLNRHRDMVQRGEAFLKKHGAPGVFLGRFCGPVRAVAPLLAGMARMKPGVFWAANVTSAAIWAPVVMLPGALVGWVADGTANLERWLAAGAAAVVLAAGAWVVLRRRAVRLPRG